MKKFIFLLFVTLLFTSSFAQITPTTYPFAERKDGTLYLDLYQPNSNANGYCIIYVFGGGFKTGARDSKENVSYCQKLVEIGYTVAAIDYRLGLKEVTKMGITHIKTLENAITIAVEDLYAATKYLIDNGEKMKIDRNKMIILGTSAGAITVLEAEYKLANNQEIAKCLPQDFNYAGVVSFSGAIFSREGKIDYKRTPAPTLMYHGTADKLVTYKKIQLFNIGFFGTSEIVKRFQKFEYPYQAYHFDELGHEVAGHLELNIATTDRFIQEYISGKNRNQIDSYVDNLDYQVPWYSKISPRKLYKMTPEEMNKMSNKAETKIQHKARR